MKKIKVKQSKSGECYLDLKDFKEFVNIKKVKQYKIEECHDDIGMVLILSFYDEDGNFINCKDSNPIS